MAHSEDLRKKEADLALEQYDITPPSYINLDPENPLHVSIWNDVMDARPVTEWYGPDLLLAAELTRTLADLEQHREMYRGYDAVESRESGTYVSAHVKASDALLARALRISSALRITATRRAGDSRAHNGSDGVSPRTVRNMRRRTLASVVQETNVEDKKNGDVEALKSRLLG